MPDLPPSPVDLGALHAEASQEEWFEILALIDAYRIAREALEFYADPGTYFAVAMLGDPPCGPFMDEAEWSETDDLGWKPGNRARTDVARIDALVAPPTVEQQEGNDG